MDKRLSLPVFVQVRPISKGSMRILPNRKGLAWANSKSITKVTKSVKDACRALISAMGIQKKNDVVFPIAQAVELNVTFWFKEPKNKKTDYPSLQHKAGDIDKLLRTLLDALTGIVYDDDTQVTTVTMHKAFCEDGQEEGIDFKVAPRKSKPISYSRKNIRKKSI